MTRHYLARPTLLAAAGAYLISRTPNHRQFVSRHVITGSVLSETTNGDLTPIKFLFLHRDEVTDLLKHEVGSRSPLRERSSVMRACLFVCLYALFLGITRPNLAKLSVSFTYDPSSIFLWWVAKCYVLPVLRMMLYLHIMARKRRHEEAYTQSD